MTSQKKRNKLCSSQTLIIATNALCDLSPLDNWTCNRLEKVDLSYNRIDNEAIKKCITIMKQKWLYTIKELNISNNIFSKLPASIGSLSKLQVITFCHKNDFRLNSIPSSVIFTFVFLSDLSVTAKCNYQSIGNMKRPPGSPGPFF